MDEEAREQRKWRCPECGTLHVFPAPSGVGYKECCLRRSMEELAKEVKTEEPDDA